MALPQIERPTPATPTSQKRKNPCNPHDPLRLARILQPVLTPCACHAERSLNMFELPKTSWDRPFFNGFDFGSALSLQRGANFTGLYFQKRPGPGPAIFSGF